MSTEDTREDMIEEDAPMREQEPARSCDTTPQYQTFATHEGATAAAAHAPAATGTVACDVANESTPGVYGHPPSSPAIEMTPSQIP